MARKQTSIKVDVDAWQEAKEIFQAYNLTLSDAINIFLNKVRMERGMPFDIKLPPKRDERFFERLRRRHLKIDPKIDVDKVMNGLNDGLS